MSCRGLVFDEMRIALLLFAFQTFALGLSAQAIPACEEITIAGPTEMTAFLDVQNVYMNESAVSYIYGFDYTQRAAFHQLPIVPTVGLRGEF